MVDTPTRRKVVGNYILGSQLGRGSFAVVWQGQHRVTGATVAVKEINTNQLNAKLKQSLECEVSILKRVEHRNIVRLQETLEERNRMYLVMEFCAGGDLAHYIRRCKRVPEVTAHGLMLQLAAGLQEMWSHNLVHRDLKPQNLLLSSATPGAVLKIADFGFARNLQPQGLAETLCGSPLYMAPEILHFHKYDAKADLWSVGTILFELLTGRPPFHGDNHVELLRNIERSPPRIPTDLNLSPACRRLLSGLLKRNPVERISFEEFFSDPWLTTAVGPLASPGPADIAVERSAGSGTRPAGSSAASTGTGLAEDLLPFMIDGSQEGSTGAARPVPVVGGMHAPPGAPLLMSSTRLDALIGPLTPSVTDTSLAHMAGNSRASSTSGAGGRRPGPAAASGSAADTMDEDDYVMVDGSSIGARAAALLAQQQPPSPTSLAALRRRGLAAMWHPLSPPVAQTSPWVLAARPPPSPRAPAQHSHPQQLHSGATRRQSADLGSHRRPSADSSASTATTSGAGGLARAASATSAITPHISSGGGGAMTAFIGTAVDAAAAAGQLPQPRSYAEALEHVAGALESLAAQATRHGSPSKGLSLRLLALQLLQLALVAKQQPGQLAGGATIGPSPTQAAGHAGHNMLLCRSSSAPVADPVSTLSSGISSPVYHAASADIAPRMSAALHAVSANAQRNATALAHYGTGGGDLPDAWEAAYEGGLELSQAAAAEELLGNFGAAAHAYAKAMAIMMFIAGEAARLPLQPALELNPPQLARVQRYVAAISSRLASVGAHLQQPPSAAAPTAEHNDA